MRNEKLQMENEKHKMRNGKRGTENEKCEIKKSEMRNTS